MMTLAGGKAAGIARWAWSDPAERVQTAIEQVNELATQTDDPDELAEIGDTATMLSRLAGTLRPKPVLTIGAQLSVEETIGAQLLDLARSPAWMHEKRGPHGEWERGPGSPLRRTSGLETSPRLKAERGRQLAAARQQRLVAAEVKRQMAQAPKPAAPSSRADTAPALGAGNVAAQIAEQARSQLATPPKYDPQHGYDPKIPTNAPPFIPASVGPAWEKEHEAFFQQRVAPHVASKAAEVLNAAQAKALEMQNKAAEIAAQEEETKSKHDAMLKAATEGSVAIVGGILAYIEAKLGVPDLVAIASATGPILIQIIIEFFKRL